MKKFILLFAVSLFATASLSAQVVNFGKTLPVDSYSIGIAPVFNSWKLGTEAPMSYMVFGGYGIGYDVDMGFKYGYYEGKDYFGLEMQYLIRETRRNYVSVVGGIHKWKQWGVDGTISITHAPQYWLNLSTGLDLDADFTNSLVLNAWIPLNIGVNAGESFFIFLEYDLPATNSAWDIFTGGVNFIIR